MEKIFLYGFCWCFKCWSNGFEFERYPETNTDVKEIKVYNYDNIEITKGECLGYFKMGSTVVMIWKKIQ